MEPLRQIGRSTVITDELWRAADELLCRRFPAEHLLVWLVGMGVSGLNDTGLVQGQLFDQAEREKRGRLDAVADEIKEWFGKGAMRRGSTLGRTKQSGAD